MSIEHIILSRTDSIGDVMLTLPLAGLLKERFPTARITFIGRTYTRTILEHCAHVDHVITLEELMATDAATVLRDLRADALIHVFPNKHIARWARSAGISRRIGTTNRWWHWTTCNERVAFSRRKSDLHEAQLNVKLLAPLGISETPTLDRLLRSSSGDRCRWHTFLGRIDRCDRRCACLGGGQHRPFAHRRGMWHPRDRSVRIAPPDPPRTLGTDRS